MSGKNFGAGAARQAGSASETRERRGALAIMGSLIGLVRPLLHIMLLAIILGTVGYLCAIFLTILAGQALLQALAAGGGIPAALAGSGAGFFAALPLRTILLVMTVMAVLRGVLHYAEQYCNHFIAFKLLAIIRHEVFAALRRLCPAKLEGRDRGNLIAILTTDIELLEVFYAHTISPIAIAVLTSLFMVLFIGSYSAKAGLLALAAYLVVGAAIPLRNGSRGGDTGMRFRTEFGELNSFVLDSLRGLDETMQYGQGEKRERQMEERSDALAGLQKRLSRLEGHQRAVTNLAILLASVGMLFLTLHLFGQGQLGFDGVLACTTAMMGSFGPTAALSSLSNNLNQTLASGERVLSILEEEPVAEEIPEPAAGADAGRTAAECCADGAADAGRAAAFAGAQVSHVDFSYGEEAILRDYSLQIAPGKITGIHGPSGCGKSTLLRLLMRFWKTQGGEIRISGENIEEIPTKRLRESESCVMQETQIFHDSIANNIAIGKPGATRAEIEAAAKKASLHEFVQTLPQGYDTEVGELGDTLSGGERQRIGIARAFLHDAPFLLLDEPTSNLDSLNEGIILKALKEEAAQRTVVLVSHRKSTMNAADVVCELGGERAS